MKTYTYEIIESQNFIEDIGLVTVYGIQIYNSDAVLAQNYGEHSHIDDISPVYDDVKRLKDLMEELELYPVHLRDVAEDFLS